MPSPPIVTPWNLNGSNWPTLNRASPAQTQQLAAAQTAFAGQRTALDEAARQVSRQMTELDRQREQIERDAPNSRPHRRAG